MKAVLLISVVATACVVLGYFLIETDGEKNTRLEVLTQNQQISSLIALNIAPSIAQKDVEKVNTALLNFDQIYHPEYVIVVTNDDSVFYAIHKSVAERMRYRQISSSALNENDSINKLSIPLIHQSKTIGNLYCGFNQKSIVEQFRSDHNRSFIYACYIAFVVICLTLAFFFLQWKQTKQLIKSIKSDLQDSGIDREINDLSEGLNVLKKRRQEEAVRLVTLESLLRESQERFLALTENMSDVIAFFDRSGIVKYIGGSIRRLTGYSPDQFMEKSFFEYVHPDDVSFLIQHFREIVNGPSGEVQSHIEARLHHLSGEWKDVEFTFTNLLNEAPMQTILVHCRDITEQKKQETTIREQAALLNITPDAVYVCDLEDRILFWNKGAEKLYGSSEQQVRSKKIFEVVHHELPMQREEIYGILIRNGWWSGEVRYFRGGKAETIIESRWTLMRDAHDAPQAVLIVDTDITGRKQLEAQASRAQRMESLATLAGGIAHDLNNVLAPLMMSIEILQTKLLDEQSARVLATLETNTMRGAEIVKQVLTFAKGIQGQRIPVQIGHLIKDMEKTIQHFYPKNIKAQTEVEPDLGLIMGDPAQIQQVIMNICSNAKDVMPDGGRIIMRADNVYLSPDAVELSLGLKSGLYVRLRISDSGAGIPEEIQDRIFEPFFTTKEIGKGVGLGLSTAISIIRNHGGTITFTSEEKKGTEFEIFLPIEQLTIRKEIATASPSTQQGHGRLVMVVDDESAIRNITKEILEARGYRVLIAQDGVEAINLLRTSGEKIEATIVDMSMPVMDGIATIKAIRSILPSAVIIASAGFHEDMESSAFKELGIDHTITKPYTAGKLLAVLEDVLNRLEQSE